MAVSPPLLVEWSPGSVRVVDPATGATSRGATIAGCGAVRGREAVVAVGRRSAFVRAIAVPPASRGEVERVVGFGLLGALPLEPRETVFGYRLSADRRVASVGAMRVETLVRLHAEAQAAGLRVRAVVPVAYGAWLAARERGLARCVVVSLDDGLLDVDVIDGGELVYSRSAPASSGEVEDEVLRTLATAGLPPVPTLALAAPELAAEVHDGRDALARLVDTRELFTMELPAVRAARRARARRMRIGRALAAAALALATAGYAVTSRVKAARPVAIPKALDLASRGARRERADTEARAEAATRANRVLNAAFGAAQTPTDVVMALAAAVPSGVWATDLSAARGAPASLQGYALHSADIRRLFETVSKDARFHGMRVVSTNGATVEKTPVVQFTLSGDAVGAAPFDRPVKKEKKAAKAQPRNR